MHHAGLAPGHIVKDAGDGHLLGVEDADFLLRLGQGGEGG